MVSWGTSQNARCSLCPKTAMDRNDLIRDLIKGALNSDLFLSRRNNFGSAHVESRILFITAGHLEQLAFGNPKNDVSDIGPVNAAGTHRAGLHCRDQCTAFQIIL